MSGDIHSQYAAYSDISWTQSHKLRGPLTTMQGIIGYLNEGNIDPEIAARLLAGLKEKLDEMDKVIHEIVDAAEH